MDQQNRFPKDQYPTTRDLAAAIKKLPDPNANVSPQTVEIVAGPATHRYRVTFVARQNPALSTPTWFWGVESSERIVPEDGDGEGPHGPGSGGSGTGGTGG